MSAVHGFRRGLFLKFRATTRLTLMECSKLSGISDAMLSQFENGNRNLSGEYWLLLSESMGNFLADLTAESIRLTRNLKTERREEGACFSSIVSSLYGTELRAGYR